MNTKVPQQSWTSGEVGSYVTGRNDLDIYRTSAQTIENFLVLPHGALYRRPGFEYIDTLTSSTGKFRLANFNFNDEQEYLLVFQEMEIHIYRNDTLVSTETNAISGIRA